MNSNHRFLVLSCLWSVTAVAFGAQTGTFNVLSPAGSGLDRETLSCIGCHDGAMGRNISYALPEGAAGSENHPIGRAYADAVLRKPGEFMPEVVLDERIVLVDGMVSCVSCHKKKDDADLQNDGWLASCTATKELTVPKGASRLCMSCHNK